MNLLLLEPAEVDEAGVAVVAGPRARHLRNVLGATPGHTVRVGVIEGPLGTGTVLSLDDGTATLQCSLEATRPDRPSVDLLLALPRPKVLRRLWAQLAALGVGQIILTNAERVERNYFDTHLLHADCYRPLLLEGLQQARDTRLPLVSIHRRLKVLVEDDLDGLFERGTRVVAHPGGAPPLGAALGTALGGTALGETARGGAVLGGTAARGSGEQVRVLLAVGPEGGWSAFELQLLEAHGFRTIGMGTRTLRSDTACIALLALLHDAMDVR